MTGEELIAFIKDRHLKDYEVKTFINLYGEEMLPVEIFDIVIYDDEQIIVM